MIIKTAKEKSEVSVYTSKIEFAYFEYSISNGLNFYPDKGAPKEW